jgi:hypothetical protein
MARMGAFMRFFALAVVLTPVVVLNVRIGVQRSRCLCYVITPV